MSRAVFCTVVLIIRIMFVSSEQNVKPHQNDFPNIFYMDDYYECSKQEGNTYCTANINLVPIDFGSESWKKMQEWSTPWNHFNRSIIHRTLCIPRKYEDYLAKKGFVENQTNEELKIYNLSAIMFSIDCKENEPFFSDTTKIISASFIYIALVIMATVYDQTCNTNNKIGRWLNCFSLTSNWKKLTSDKNPDFQRLKFIQGIRTFQTTLIILCHVLLTVGQLPIKNTSFVEELYLYPLLREFIVFLMFVMQTYFVISSWLLTNQVLEIFKRNGRFTVRDGLLLFLHRITRFWMPLLFMIFLEMALSTNLANGPGNFEIANLLIRSCNKNWWATLFQVTNLVNINEVCNPGMWSLSLDTQFYIIGIMTLYVILNYKWDIKKCLTFMFIFSYIVNIAIFYQKELPLLRWINAKLAKRIDFFNDEALAINYFGFWINIGSSLIGILFGYLYFKNKESTKTEALEKLCGPIFAVIPISAVLIGTLEANQLVSILVGPLLKPLYAFGIASGIYGMSRNIIQGWAKSICENKYAVLLGNFTFTTYIFHFGIVFTKEAHNTSVVELTSGRLAIWTIFDLVTSFAIGIFCALAVEQPGINIKKMILPKTEKKVL